MKVEKSVLTDEMIKDALYLYYREKIEEEYPDEVTREYDFDAKHERKMQKLLRMHKKPYYKMIDTVGKRVAVIILTVLVLLSTATFSVKALREPVVRFIITTYEKFSSLVFGAEGVEDIPKEIKEFFEPTYVVEGYREDSRNQSPIARSITYTKGDSVYIFRQYVLDGSEKIVDTENANAGMIEIEAGVAYYFVKNAESNLVWEDGKYSYFVGGTISREEAIAIANSIGLK